MIDVPVVDAHHHLCRLSDGYPWLSGEPIPRYHGDDTALRRDYSMEDYRADCAGIPVCASVVVENGAASPLREAEWVDGVLAGTNSVQVAKADLLDPSVPALLEEYAGFSTIRGVRDILNWDPDPYYSHRARDGIMNESAWRENFARLESLGLSFDLQIFPRQLVDAARLADAFPSTRIVLDHLGMPIYRNAEYLRNWGRGLRELARRENVFVKLSALGTTDHHWTEESIRGPLLTAIDAFGVKRSMFGSNFPVDSLYSDMRTLFSAFAAVVADFSDGERRRLFAGTATDFYRMDGGRLQRSVQAGHGVGGSAGPGADALMEQDK
ncbi:Predicted metal-dependent hydrolase, TIM-barrel fold [Actinomyces ruminicola]|uniref:Predicted metal-dependent hydrolase, TIM-barrel fold n=1 Tax=Actinomyces ruminicola TaxID=332524 RepID=A0A1H0BZN7_9ACTO|nr:amidohydrolase family protein [Actinomyces ruminicola]SDN51178.1 Predicted metal-dependent hydrolase, TIM-barrel fold [Actinomyces ruminicola]